MGATTSGRGVSVVVLAAGHGRRLGRAGGLGPKWLIGVGGAPIADRHLAAIEDALGAGTDVVAVVGHRADRVGRYCESRHGALRPRLVVNDQHASRNNWYSLLVALDDLEARIGGDDVVIVVNSDLFAPTHWLAALLGALSEVGDVPGLLAVDVVRPLTAEAMKVAAGPPDVDGHRWCTAIGKVGVEEPVGEYVGMAALGPSGRGLVHEALRAFAADGDRDDAWYEGAFQEAGAALPFLVVCPTPSSEWVEIDDADDLSAAERLAALVTPDATASEPGRARRARRAPPPPGS